MRIGICGGTFDPIHTGHLLIGQEMADLLELDRVLYIPAKTPPHKLDCRITGAVHRLEMVRLATADNSLFEVSDLELRRQGLSYTVDTLNYLHKTGLNGEMFFLMGQDAFNEIETWFHYSEIFSLCRIVVVTRPGSEALAFSSYSPVIQELLTTALIRIEDRSAGDRHRVREGHWRICMAEMPSISISASEIRRRVAESRSIRYLVPDSVRDYIQLHNLYRDNGTVTVDEDTIDER